MPRLKRLTAKDVLNALSSFGFETVKTRGSHAKLKRVNRQGHAEILTIPLHKELALGTIRAIYRQAQRYIQEENLRRFFFEG
jgi:predicted RNA binding protein YcfA (HicA-like mRNA interferase family)